MQKLTDVVLILGFLFIDFILFHDYFKPGETTTVVQYLIGILSIVVFFRLGYSLARN